MAPREDGPLAGMARQAGVQPARQLAPPSAPYGGRAGVESAGIGQGAEQLECVQRRHLAVVELGECVLGLAVGVGALRVPPGDGGG